MNKKFKIIELSVILAFIFTSVTSLISFAFDCNEIRNDVVRLHILANSDNDIDQSVKLEVRDALLSSGAELFSGNVTINDAKDILINEKKNLVSIADSVLKENGFDYTADIYLTKEYFTTRSYENFTLPAGEYLALKVVLGEGKGHNWWCVMFPPLCLPAATENDDINVVFNEDSAKIISDYQGYEIRFKFIEIIEGIKNSIKQYNICV